MHCSNNLQWILLAEVIIAELLCNASMLGTGAVLHQFFYSWFVQVLVLDACAIDFALFHWQGACVFWGSS